MRPLPILNSLARTPLINGAVISGSCADNLAKPVVLLAVA